MLVAALAVVLVDELVDGTKSAALPTMRHDLGLTYGQVGLLVSVPVWRGSLLELPLGVLAGHGRRRRLAVLGGGVLFILALVATAAARSFAGLLAAFVLFFPASGAFVSLTQSGLMDADPSRREQHMARWELAGSAGQVAGPIMLVAVLATGGGWRSAYLTLALCAVAAWLGVARHGPGVAAPPPGGDQGQENGGHHARAAAAPRAAALLYPAFLLAPGLWPKLLLLAGLTIATAPWYPVLQARLYRSLPGESGVVVSLSSAASLLGGVVPLAVGFLAQRFGLSWALTSLAVAPLCLLGGLCFPLASAAPPASPPPLHSHRPPSSPVPRHPRPARLHLPPPL